MKCILLLSVFALIAISTCMASDLLVGNSINGHLLWQQKAEYMGIPFKKRVKEAFFSDPGLNVIRVRVIKFYMASWNFEFRVQSSSKMFPLIENWYLLKYIVIFLIRNKRKANSIYFL